MTALGLCSAGPGTASAQDLSLRASTGFDYSVGGYGNVEDTTIIAVPFSVTAEWGAWTSSLSTYWLQIEGPGGVTVGTDGTPIVTGPAGAVETNSGLGDTSASLAYSLAQLWEHGTFVDITGTVKLPTGDEDRGLSNGEVDYTVKLDVAQSFGQILPFATIGYRFLGDENLDDQLQLSVGAQLTIQDGVSVGASYDWRAASTAASDDSSELFAYGSWRFTEDWSATLYGIAGFTDGSPDSGGGITLTWRSGAI